MDFPSFLKNPKDIVNKLDRHTRKFWTKCPKCKDTGRDNRCICNCGCPEAVKHLEEWKAANGL